MQTIFSSASTSLKLMNTCNFICVQNPVADLYRQILDTPQLGPQGPIFFISIQFSAKLGRIIIWFGVRSPLGNPDQSLECVDVKIILRI